jgi:pimeloyl-ACP methyl ester carboxylesterase
MAVVPGAGHMVPLERAGEFNEVLAEFVRGVEGKE